MNSCVYNYNVNIALRLWFSYYYFGAFKKNTTLLTEWCCLVCSE